MRKNDERKLQFKTIELDDLGDGLKLLTLNRPTKKNALSIEMRQELTTALREMKENVGTILLIITGAGDSFSAGFDLKEFQKPELLKDIFESSTRYHRELWNFPKPIIAAVGGPALGGGFDLATFCDVRICADTAVFGHPEIKFGAPPLFTPLRWIVGSGVASNLCLTGRKIGADEAFRIGLVSQISSTQELIQKAEELAREILEAPKDTLVYTKSFLRSNLNKDFEESFVVEHDILFTNLLNN